MNKSTPTPSDPPSRTPLSDITWYRIWLALAFLLLMGLGIILCINRSLRELIFPEYFSVLCLLMNEIIWSLSESKALGRARDKERFQDVSKLARFFTFVIIFGIYLVVRLGWSHELERHRVLFVILIWCLAFLTLGGLVGFLFGIPRTLAGSAPEREAEAKRASDGRTPAYRVNTNLERVSDWLTQIIVGGTVTQAALFPKYWDALGTYFAGALGMAPVGAWPLAGAGSTLYFLCVGFLGSYLITRLYLAGAIQRADDSGSEQVAKLSNLTMIELESLEAAPLQYGDAKTQFDPLAKAAADKIMKLELDELTHWRDLRVWGKAQLAADAPKKAIDGYVQVIEIVPEDAETRLGYAIALGRSNNQPGLVLTQLERARASVMASTPRDLRKNIFKSLIYAQLFLKKPESFQKALATAREYFGAPAAVESATITFNIACAYGQAYAWLAHDSTRKLSSAELAYRPEAAGDSRMLENKEAMSRCRSGALETLRVSIERSATSKEKLKQMLTPPPPTDADDFASFVDDNDFRKLAGLDVKPAH